MYGNMESLLLDNGTLLSLLLLMPTAQRWGLVPLNKQKADMSVDDILIYVIILVPTPVSFERKTHIHRAMRVCAAHVHNFHFHSICHVGSLLVFSILLG